MSTTLMNCIKRLSLIFLFVLFLLPANYLTAQEVRLWTLEECIEYAWENNLQLRQQHLSVDIAKENLLQSRANRFPSLNANASHSYSYGRTVDPFTNDFTTESVRSNNFGVNSSVNLFSGFQTQNVIRQNRLEVQASHYDLERSYNDIALMVASAYLQVLFSSEMVDIAKSQIDITQQQVNRTQRLVEAGTLPRGSLLTIQAQLATEEMQLVNAENQLDLAYLNLSQILFLPEDEQLLIEHPDIELSAGQEPEQSPLQVYEVAVRHQPEIRSADLRISSAERGLAIARGGRSPMLSLRGSYGTGYSEASMQRANTIYGEPVAVGFTESGETVFAPSVGYEFEVQPFSEQIRDNLSRSIGLNLTIPVFNNYQTRSGISRSKINLEGAILQSQIAREQLFQTIQQAHADAVAALKRFNATDKNLVALEESFRYTEQRFNVGMVNSVEYNDAKNRLTAAESELLQSKYEYLFRIKILDFYLGNPLSFN